MFIHCLVVLADLRLISLSGSGSDWRPSNDNWCLVGVAEVEFIENLFEDEKGVGCKLCEAGQQCKSMMILQSFLCRSPFIAKFSKDTKGFNEPVIEAQSLSVKVLIGYSSLFRGL